MQIAEAESDSGRVLKLSGELRIRDAEELRAALLDFVCTASRPVLDLSAVTECDAAGLQLLVSARCTAQRSAKLFQLVGVPAAVQRTAAALGLCLTLMPNDNVAGTPEDRLIPGRSSEAA